MILPDLNKVTTILFDFDGVIADTENGRYDAYCEILNEYGYDMRNTCSMYDLAGLTGDGFMKRFFPEIPQDQADEIVFRRQGHYMKHLDRFCIPFPGMLRTIKDLEQKGYFLALTTANTTSAAKKLLDFVGVLPYFDAVLGREICENPATKAKDYRLVPEKINKTIEECVVVEDSPVGIAGAKKAGFYCIAFISHDQQELAGEADIVVNNYNELRKMFLLPEIDL